MTTSRSTPTASSPSPRSSQVCRSMRSSPRASAQNGSGCGNWGGSRRRIRGRFERASKTLRTCIQRAYSRPAASSHFRSTTLQAEIVKKARFDGAFRNISVIQVGWELRCLARARKARIYCLLRIASSHQHAVLRHSPRPATRCNAITGCACKGMLILVVFPFRLGQSRLIPVGTVGTSPGLVTAGA